MASKPYHPDPEERGYVLQPSWQSEAARAAYVEQMKQGLLKSGESSQSARKQPEAPEIDPFGLGWGGKRSARWVLETKFRKRAAAGEVLSSKQKEMEWLKDWYDQKIVPRFAGTDCPAPPLELGTLLKNMAGIYTEHKASLRRREK